MLRVTVLEMPAVYGDPAAALDALDHRLAALAGAALPPSAAEHLVVLPEAALTGYVSPRGDFDLSRFAEPRDGPTCARLSTIAARHGVHLLAPLVLEEGARAFNAVALFDASGELVFVYAKRHPWMPETWASPGEAPPPIATVGDVTVSVCVCFDVHFVGDEHADALSRCDLLLFPSAWVDEHPGEDARAEILGGLAKRFGIAIANANWGPGVVRVNGQGRSRVVGPDGRLLAEVAPNAELEHASATVEVAPRRGGRV